MAAWPTVSFKAAVGQLTKGHSVPALIGCRDLGRNKGVLTLPGDFFQPGNPLVVIDFAVPKPAQWSSGL